MYNIVIVFFLLFPFLAISQDLGRGLFIKDNRAEKITWIDQDGKVIRVFEKDQKPKLDYGTTKDPRRLFSQNNYIIHNFTIGHLPVRYPDGWQFYNSKGQLMFSLDTSYYDISLASNGNFIATVKDSTWKIQYVYLDEKGMELFQGRTFTYTSEFRNHIAFAAQGDTWYILKSKSNTCIPIENPELGTIYEIKRNTALYSLAILKAPNGTRRVLIDTLAQIKFTSSMCGDYAMANIASFDDQLLICTQQNKATLYDMQGKFLLELEDLAGLDNLSDDFVLFRMKDGEKKLFDLKMKPALVEVPRHCTYTYHGISNQFILVNILDTLTNQKSLGLFDADSKKMVYRMAAYNFGGLMGDRIIYAELVIGRLEYMALTTLEGEILDAKINRDKIYNIAIARHFPKTDIMDLIVVQDEGIEKLPAYDHVKQLVFEDCSFKQLPACVCQFSNLESITLRYCEKLTSLPACLGKLPKFNDLLIEDCTNLSTLEEFLLHYPRTLVINTRGRYFSAGFNKVIKEKLPHIKLTSWTDNWFLNDHD